MEWFENWFETKYYHILYSNRTEGEAESFIEKLYEHLKLSPGKRVLDLACGRGRHSRKLAAMGCSVTGADISKNSIDFARQFEKENLNFIVHDMRKPTGLRFDAVVNLFTSFGYFEDENDNNRVISAIHEDLKKNGLFVLDFLNPGYVAQNLVPTERKKIKGFTFDISRSIENGVIIKEITVHDPEKDTEKTYYEKVTAFEKKHIVQMLENNGLSVQYIHGDYNLNEYDPRRSERMIFTAEKAAPQSN